METVVEKMQFHLCRALVESTHQYPGNDIQGIYPCIVHDRTTSINIVMILSYSLGVLDVAHLHLCSQVGL